MRTLRAAVGETAATMAELKPLGALRDQAHELQALINCFRLTDRIAAPAPPPAPAKPARTSPAPADAAVVELT